MADAAAVTPTTEEGVPPAAAAEPAAEPAAAEPAASEPSAEPLAASPEPVAAAAAAAEPEPEPELPVEQGPFVTGAETQLPITGTYCVPFVVLYVRWAVSFSLRRRWPSSHKRRAQIRRSTWVRPCLLRPRR